MGSQSREVRLINSVAILAQTSSVLKGSPCFPLRLKGSPCDSISPSRRLASRMMPQKRTRLCDHTVTCQCEACAHLNNLPPMEDDPAHMGMEEVRPLGMPAEIAAKATPPHEIPSPPAVKAPPHMIPYVSSAAHVDWQGWESAMWTCGFCTALWYNHVPGPSGTPCADHQGGQLVYSPAQARMQSGNCPTCHVYWGPRDPPTTKPPPANWPFGPIPKGPPRGMHVQIEEF